MTQLLINSQAMVKPWVNNGASIGIGGSATVTHNSHPFADRPLPPTITMDEYDKKHHLGKYADGSNTVES